MEGLRPSCTWPRTSLPLLSPPPVKPAPDRIQTEQEVREDLAAAYRLVALFGISTLCLLAMAVITAMEISHG